MVGERLNHCRRSREAALRAGSNLTLAALDGARMVGTRPGPEGDEYEFERKDGRLVVLHPARIIRAEPADPG